jgi:hypothetical protein
MTLLYPIVLETEDSGAVSAYVPGLPLYAAAETHAKAERAIRGVLTDYLNAHPASRPDARVRVAALAPPRNGAPSRRGNKYGSTLRHARRCDPDPGALRFRVPEHRRAYATSCLSYGPSEPPG